MPTWMRCSRGLLLAALTSAACVDAATPPAEWPQWRGPLGNGHAPAGVKAPATLPAEPRVVWRQKIGAGLGSPVVAQGKVFYLDNQGGKETAHAADSKTGSLLWSVPIDDTFKDHQSAPGPRSTPLVDQDRVYVQSCRGEFRCLSVADGRTLWRKNFVEDFKAIFVGEKGTAAGASRHGNNGSPWIEGDRIFLAAGGQEGASIVCLDKRTGEVRWTSQSDPAGYGGPVIGSPGGVKQVLAFTVQGAIGLRYEDGALLWRVPVKTSFGRHVASPLVLDDLVIVGSHQAGTMALKITRDGDGARAETAWLEKRIAINFSSPVLIGGHLYGLGPAGMMFCADARTGTELWSTEISRGGNNAQAQFVVVQDKILALTDAGELFLVAADPKQARILGRLKVAASTWCNPAYVDGRLFLRDESDLLCIDLRP
jgi:outer membrane protein assembly factor BamB